MESASAGVLLCLSPCWAQTSAVVLHLVVASQPVDAGLDQDEPELAVLVLPVALQVLAHGHCLLDQEVQVLWNIRGQAAALQDTQDLAAGHGGDLGDAVLVTQQHTDGTGGHTLLGQLADLVVHLLKQGRTAKRLTETRTFKPCATTTCSTAAQNETAPAVTLKLTLTEPKH